nr:LytTR family DNA-binding domain-containing protein [uncultured Blautia sp.]
MNIALIDDMPQALTHTQELIRQFASSCNMDFSITCYSSSEELLADFTPHKYSILFIDIYMDGLTGIEAAQQIRLQDDSCLIIFLTSSNDHLPQAFRCHAFDYLQKPATQEDISRVLRDAMRLLRTEIQYLEFTCSRQTIRVPYTEIVSILSDDHRTIVTDHKGNRYDPLIGFSKLTAPLENESRFCLINRGILVNMDYISGFDSNLCILSGGQKLPVSTRRISKIRQQWEDYTFSSIRRKMTERSLLT